MQGKGKRGRVSLRCLRYLETGDRNGYVARDKRLAGTGAKPFTVGPKREDRHGPFQKRKIKRNARTSAFKWMNVHKIERGHCLHLP